MEHAHVGYLEAKRAVDDTALDAHLAEVFRERLPDTPTIVDLGCGTGSMLGRLLEWGVTDGEYIGIDADGSVLEAAQRLRVAEARERGHTVGGTTDETDIGDLSVRFEQADALERLGTLDAPDAIIGLSFADLVGAAALVETVGAVAAAGTQLYLPITFDDLTVFAPTDATDDAVIGGFHATMRREGSPDVGRRLISRLQRAQGHLEVGTSDWMVRPHVDGYTPDERRFLQHILRLIEAAVAEVPGAAGWLRRRRAQLEAGELWYIAHQYDLLHRF
jgi:SAM-dependent methyltransferase